MTIEMGKKYTNGYGEIVKILVLDAGGDFPVVGLREEMTTWRADHYSLEGKIEGDYGLDSSMNIREVKEKKKAWVNIYRGLNIYNDDNYLSYSLKTTKEIADQNADNIRRVACVEIEYYEGQGLEEK